MLRALPYDLSHISLAQGASTITEQVAKLVYLGSNDHTPWRKLADALVALKLENHYSKQAILAAYLNSAYFGHGAYGVAAASRRYFGLPPARLSLAQASLLAGLPQAPSSYDPLAHPDAARRRQIAVLRSLVRNGFVTSGEAERALGSPLVLRTARRLPLVTGASLNPGPTFIWWQLALGVGLALAGVSALGLRRRITHVPIRTVTVVASLLLVLLGTATAVRAFRVA
jgi:membrane peptidoglycan carboxypeptidase